MQGHHHHHHHGGGGGGDAQGGGFSKLAQAVTSALQSAQSTDGSSTDPNQIIENAISNVLGGGTSAQASTAATAGTAGSTTTAQVAGADPDNSKQAFLQTLQQFGVTPEQFHADFLAAVKDAQQGGSVDPNAAFKSFPPGMMVDTTG
jgi:hypothetical protein